MASPSKQKFFNLLQKLICTYLQGLWKFDGILNIQLETNKLHTLLHCSILHQKMAKDKAIFWLPYSTF
jgi:hypothetical protein